MMWGQGASGRVVKAVVRNPSDNRCGKGLGGARVYCCTCHARTGGVRRCRGKKAPAPCSGRCPTPLFGHREERGRQTRNLRDRLVLHLPTSDFRTIWKLDHDEPILGSPTRNHPAEGQGGRAAAMLAGARWDVAGQSLEASQLAEGRAAKMDLVGKRRRAGGPDWVPGLRCLGA